MPEGCLEILHVFIHPWTADGPGQHVSHAKCRLDRAEPNPLPVEYWNCWKCPEGELLELAFGS